MRNKLGSWGDRFTTSKALREEIRKGLGYSNAEIDTDSQMQLGDLRAHGDAVGGHLLGLRRYRRSGRNLIWITEGNAKKCARFLRDRSKLLTPSEEENRKKRYIELGAKEEDYNARREHIVLDEKIIELLVGTEHSTII